MQPAQLLADLQHDLRSVFDTIEIAEDENSAAQRRHPQAADLIWRSSKLAELPPIDLADASTRYEALDGALIDDQEAMLRQKLSQDWRLLPPSSPPGPDR